MVFRLGNMAGISGLLGRVGAGVPSVEGGIGLPPEFTRTGGRYDLKHGDFLSADASNCKSTKYQEIGAKTVLAQMSLRFGFGAAAVGQNINQGFVYLKPRNAVGLITYNGTMRLVWKDASKLKTEVVKEVLTETTQGSKTDRGSQVLLPEHPTGPLSEGRNWSLQDEHLALDFKPDTDDITVGYTGSDMVVSCTQYFK